MDAPLWSLHPRPLQPKASFHKYGPQSESPILPYPLWMRGRRGTIGYTNNQTSLKSPPLARRKLRWITTSVIDG